MSLVTDSLIAEDVENRLTDLLRAGTRLVRVIYPASQPVMVFRQGPNCSRRSRSDSLDGEDVLPGFA